MPLISQSSLPLVSYDRTFLLPVVTISARRSLCHTNGVDQFDFSPSRSVRHSSLPVRASNAATNDRSSLSLTMYRRPLSRTGDEADPQPVRIFGAVIGLGHTGLPLLPT